MNATPTPSEQTNAKDLRQPEVLEAVKLLKRWIVNCGERGYEPCHKSQGGLHIPGYCQVCDSIRFLRTPVGDKPSVSGVAGNAEEEEPTDTAILAWLCSRYSPHEYRIFGTPNPRQRAIEAMKNDKGLYGTNI